MMNSKALGLQISGTIFGVIAIFHFLRLVTGVPIMIGGCSIPIWMNVVGFLATAFLCFWLWWLSGRENE
jgi:predicted Co/Zn/Cd cation transporter (cation efflux family)